MEQEPNYYNPTDQSDSLKYRLDGMDIITQAIDTLKGGVKSDVNGVKVYYDDQRLMNDLGVSKAKMVLESCVNKVSHLTNFSDEERVFRQIKAIVKTWVYELALNMKIWSPFATYDSKHKLINPTGSKVRNKYLVVSAVETAIVQSLLRGTKGFEAEITGKQMLVTEHKDFRVNSGDPSEGSSKGFWGGRT